MLEFLLFLLGLGSAIKTAFDTIGKSEKKKIARKLHQIYIEIQSIIDDAERIFGLIKDAEKNITEFGEDKYSRILSENFDTQFNKLTGLCTLLRLPQYVVVSRFSAPDMPDDMSVGDGINLDGIFQEAHK